MLATHSTNHTTPPEKHCKLVFKHWLSNCGFLAHRCPECLSASHMQVTASMYVSLCVFGGEWGWAGKIRRHRKGSMFALVVLGSVSTQRQASSSLSGLSQVEVEGRGVPGPKLLVSEWATVLPCSRPGRSLPVNASFGQTAWVLPGV